MILSLPDAWNMDDLICSRNAETGLKTLKKPIIEYHFWITIDV